jgi:hypothetical protein
MNIVNGRWLTSFLAFSILSTPLYAADERPSTSIVSEPSTSEETTQLTDPVSSENKALPDIEPALEPATESIPEPATESTPELAAESTPELVEESTPDPVAKPEPVSTPVTKPLVKIETKSSLNQLIQFVEQSKFAQAYQLGLTLHEQWEGEEQFDFNFALAASQTDHYNQALFPFERLLETYPNNLRFRLELARCYYFLNNLPAAEREFNLVASNNPPEEVQSHIARFLDRIAEQKQQVSQSWAAGAGIALGYDSNINAAADIDAINATFYNDNNVPTLTGSLVLADEQKSQGSSYYQLQGYGYYQQPLSKRSSLDARLSASQKDNSANNDYDLTNLSLNGGITFLRYNHNFRFGGIARQYWLAGETLQNQLLATARWQWHFSPIWKARTELEMGVQDNSQNDALDFSQWQGKFAIHRNINNFAQSLQLSLGSNIAQDSENDFQGSSYTSLGYQAQQQLTESQQMYALASYRNNAYSADFASDDIFFADEKRTDNIMQITAGWVYSFMPSTAIKLQINHSQNQSNLELYDYQRTIIEAGLSLAFK